MPPKLIVIALVLAAVALVFWMKKRRPIEIGRELAAAREHELRRKKLPHEPSPLPQESYPFQGGSFGLLNPQPAYLDERLRAACRDFRTYDEGKRRTFRAAASMEDFSTLLQFARRQSVFALRSGNADQLTDALTALAIIEAKRTDFRDILTGLALLHHTASRIGVDADRILATSAAFAEPETRNLILGFSKRDAISKDLSKSWGFREVRTEYGAGYVRSGFKSYQPQIDLLHPMLAIARVIDADKYQTSSLEMASELREVWLKTDPPETLRAQLAQVTGGASAHASLIRSTNQVFPPGLIVFCVELKTPEAASRLADIAARKKPAEHSHLGVSAGRLFCLVVASSFVKGVPAPEDNESLKRFAAPISSILAEAQSH